jgi:hypothetical protein
LPIGGDALIGSSGGALFDAWDFPLSFASLTAELATLLTSETDT